MPSPRHYGALLQNVATALPVAESDGVIPVVTGR